MELSSISPCCQRVLVRVDYNVPMTADGQVANDKRILATLPTIEDLVSRQARVVLMSHMGRPKGSVKPELSLRPVAERLATLLGKPVQFMDQTIGEDVVQATQSLENGEILLLENLRFHSGEEAGDEAFAKALAANGDIYINDAFGTAHRAHASTTVVAQHFPGKCAFGHVMSNEIKNVNRVLEGAEPPAVAVVGGAKVSSKIQILERLLDRVNDVIIGGGMAFTFLKAQGGQVGGSLVEDDHLGTAKRILELAKDKGVHIHLPSDVVAADAFSADANTQIVGAMEIPEGWMGLDVGPQSIDALKSVVRSAKTLLWNGPLGVFEMPAFETGTRELGVAIAEATSNGLFSLVGGGDSVAAVDQFGLSQRVSYVSTGGGAMLEYLEGKVLPGIQAVITSSASSADQN